jgi:hypothetical protein
VYLKLRTAEHEFGKYGVVSHNFNLAEGDYAYLNYVPEAVEVYRRKVPALPGFWVQGPSAALELGWKFTMKHAQQLLETMVKLEEAAAG